MLMNKRTYSTEELFNVFGVKPKTVQAWCRLRGLKHLKLGRLVLVDAEDWEIRWERAKNGGKFFDD